jgi:hypothetical protein
MVAAEDRVVVEIDDGYDQAVERHGRDGDALPQLVIERWEIGAPKRVATSEAETGSTVRIADELWQPEAWRRWELWRSREPWRSWQAWRTAESLVAGDRGWDPRKSPSVLHRVHAGADAVVAFVEQREPVATESAVLVIGEEPASVDRFEHELLFSGELHLRWSWPPLPMVLAVGPLQPDRATVRLTLRTHHRLRYPYRYYRATHGILNVLALRLEAAH